jgi:hypothetical protein
VQGRFASLALSRPPHTPEAGVVVTLPWCTFTTRVTGDGTWANMRIFVPRRYRRSPLVATLASSSYLPVDHDQPDIRCLGVMVAEGEVGGDATIRFGARAMKRPHLRVLRLRQSFISSTRTPSGSATNTKSFERPSPRASE